MILLLAHLADAARFRADVCAADLVVVATVARLEYERRPHGAGTLATLTVDHLVVGPAVGVLQTRWAGGTLDGVSTRVSEQPDLARGERYLLAFRTRHDRPLPDLLAWDPAPADIALPDDAALHAAWDAVCAGGPVHGVSIDALRGMLGAGR